MASLQYKGKHFCGGSLVINFFIMPWIIITITATTLIGKMITYPNYFDKKSEDNQSTRIRIIMVTGFPSLGSHRGSLSWLSKRWRLSSSSLCCFGQQHILEFPSSQFRHNFIVILKNCIWLQMIQGATDLFDRLEPGRVDRAVTKVAHLISSHLHDRQNHHLFYQHAHKDYIQVLNYPLYDQAGYNGDLALLRLDSPVQFRWQPVMILV